MKQNNPPKSADGQCIGAEQSTTKTAKQREMDEARKRSKLNTRRNSMQAQAEAPQSMLTESPPTLYRVPQINVPADLAEAAKLIQSELAKIEKSQSVILSIWRKVQEISGSTNIVCDTLTANEVVTTPRVQAGSSGMLAVNYDDLTLTQHGNSYRAWNVCTTWRASNGSVDRALWGWMPFTPEMPGGTGAGSYGTLLTVASNGDTGYPDVGAYIDAYTNNNTGGSWVQQMAIATSADIRVRAYTNTGTWSAWKLMASTAQLRANDHKHRHRIWQLEKRVTELESRLTVALKDESTK